MGRKPLILQQQIISQKFIKKKNKINMKTHNPLKQIKERQFLNSKTSFFFNFVGQIQWNGGVFATYK
jgi:hypothetical protein